MLLELLEPLTEELQKYKVCDDQYDTDLGFSFLGEVTADSVTRGIRGPLDGAFFFPVRVMIWAMATDDTMYPR